jgi:lipopolysaccharide/colanic/teichoic acid biosynthesis glycosyltransferase
MTYERPWLPATGAGVPRTGGNQYGTGFGPALCAPAPPARSSSTKRRRAVFGMIVTGLAYRATKRVLDVCLAAGGLVLLAPLLSLVALLVWLDDPGAPVLFRQRRCGRGGRPFEMLKFRTMVRGADALKEELREKSLVEWPDFRLANDPRVTRVGRFLRRTSIDELPQLANVLRGEMSLVGPRPTSFAMTTYELWQTARLDFRPGITGPWQVHGRNCMDFVERCRLEISFFRRRSLARELWLLVQTVPCVIRRTGVA